MLSENAKRLEFNQYHKSEKALFIMYPDLECIIQKSDNVRRIQNLSTTKLSEHIPSGFLMSTIFLFI